VRFFLTALKSSYINCPGLEKHLGRAEYRIQIFNSIIKILHLASPHRLMLNPGDNGKPQSGQLMADNSPFFDHIHQLASLILP